MPFPRPEGALLASGGNTAVMFTYGVLLLTKGGHLEVFDLYSVLRGSRSDPVMPCVSGH